MKIEKSVNIWTRHSKEGENSMLYRSGLCQDVNDGEPVGPFGDPVITSMVPQKPSRENKPGIFRKSKHFFLTFLPWSFVSLGYA
jgi:hypothetical protein